MSEVTEIGVAVMERIRQYPGAAAWSLIAAVCVLALGHFFGLVAMWLGLTTFVATLVAVWIGPTADHFEARAMSCHCWENAWLDDPWHHRGPSAPAHTHRPTCPMYRPQP